MTSDKSEKNLAFLTRRVQTLEKRLTQTIELAERQAEVLDRCIDNQERWIPWIEARHIENKEDHQSIVTLLKKLIDRL